MIERLLEADRLLSLGLFDQAERIYWQAVELDPQNAIAVVGLARVALEKGDDLTALQFGRKAVEIDPESPAAQRLVARVEEVMAYRGEDVPAPRATEAASPPGDAAEPAGPIEAVPTAAAVSAPSPSSVATSAPARPAAKPKRPGLLRRLLGGR